MPTVLWNDRTTPLAVNSANTAFSSGLNLAWDFTDRDVNHKDGVPWIYVGATPPTLVKSGTHTLSTLAGEPCRVPVGASAANYDYTNTTNYGWQTGSGDFTIAVRLDTPASLPVASGNVEILRISGSAGTALSLIVQEDAGNGWYLTATGSTSIPLGTQQTAQFAGANTSFILWIRRTAGVVRILTQNATAGTDAVIRRSDATATTDMDSTWAARTLVNFGNNVTCGVAAVMHWNVAKSDADINAIGKDFWATQANSAGGDTTVPVMTGTVTSSAVTSTSFTIDWSGTTRSDNVAITGYETSPDGGTTWIDRGNVTSFNFTGLSPSTAYTRLVRAYDAAGNKSTPALSVSVTTSAASDSTLPVFTGTLTSNTVTATTAVIDWSGTTHTDNVAITGYESSINGGATWQSAGTGTSATITGLTANTSNTIQVRAFDAAGNRSTPALSINVTTPAAAATAISVSGPATGTAGAASTNFTVSANGTITGTVVVTPSATGCTFSPATVSISSGSPTATFTCTAATAGAKTISFTNNGGLTNQGNLTYTASAAAGAFTSRPMVNDSGSVFASQAGWTVRINNATTGDRIATKTSLTTSSLGVLTYSDAGCVAGTNYEHIYIAPNGDKGMQDLVAA